MGKCKHTPRCMPICTHLRSGVSPRRTQVNLCVPQAVTHTTSLSDSLLPSTLRRKIENQPLLCPLTLHTHTHTHTRYTSYLHQWFVCLYVYICVCMYRSCVCERQAAGRGVLATGITTWPLWLQDWQLWSRLIALLSQVIGSHPGGSFVGMQCGNDVN